MVFTVNVGLVAATGYAFYTRSALRRDTAVICGVAAGAIALIGAEGAVANAYRKTEAGHEEERRAREEGDAIYRQTKEIVTRPAFASGLIGVLNVSIAGAIAYIAYDNWTVPRWDRRVITGIAASVAAISVGERYVI